MTTTLTPLRFIDTEGTGLEPSKHQVWETAFADETGPITTLIVPHTLDGADPTALKINRYHERYPHGAPPDIDADARLRTALTGATLVAANPHYDMSMLEARWGSAPWHYRPINISDVAMTVFAWPRPKGMADVADECRLQGYDIPAPDHSAAADVAALRSCWFALQDLRANGLAPHSRAGHLAPPSDTGTGLTPPFPTGLPWGSASPRVPLCRSPVTQRHLSCRSDLL